jgi:F-type H+-transporting ATPase subunit epsilon
MLDLQIVTPERVAFEGEIEQITLPTSLGQITVLPGHVSLVTQIVPGELIIKQQNKFKSFAAGYGFADINSKKVSVLTDLADYAEDISEKEAEEARKRAQDALKEKERFSKEEYAQVAAALEKSLVRLKVKRRHTQHIPKPV